MIKFKIDQFNDIQFDLAYDAFEKNYSLKVSFISNTSATRKDIIWAQLNPSNTQELIQYITDFQKATKNMPLPKLNANSVQQS